MAWHGRRRKGLLSTVPPVSVHSPLDPAGARLENIDYQKVPPAHHKETEKCLTNYPALRNPGAELGAALSQCFEGEHLVLFIYLKLTPIEKIYAAVEQEALAIKWAMKELSP